MRKKLIRSGGKPFIFRVSATNHKLHIIMNDDRDGFHSHPWDFKSFILFGGYVETLEDGTVHTYRVFSINRKDRDVKHQLRLRRLFGIRIPAITIGWYGPKVGLCSLCQELGYCKSRGPNALEMGIGSATR